MNIPAKRLGSASASFRPIGPTENWKEGSTFRAKGQQWKTVWEDAHRSKETLAPGQQGSHLEAPANV